LTRSREKIDCLRGSTGVSFRPQAAAKTGILRLRFHLRLDS
jgi:hypothetical protein